MLWQTTMLTCAHCKALCRSGAGAIHGEVDTRVYLFFTNHPTLSLTVLVYTEIGKR